MFTGSTHSNRKVVHTAHCWHMKRMNPDWQISFPTLGEALAAGYSVCGCCSRMGKHYYREKFQIDRYCKAHGLQHFIRDGRLYIISKEDTVWRIVQGGKSKDAFFLQHENFKGARYIRRNVPYWDRKFHSQRVRKESITEYLEYIEGHDEYVAAAPISERPRSPKVKKPNPHSRSQRRKGIFRTLSMIESLTSDYRVPKAAQLWFY